jgi:hypothetical protein
MLAASRREARSPYPPRRKPNGVPWWPIEEIKPWDVERDLMVLWKKITSINQEDLQWSFKPVIWSNVAYGTSRRSNLLSSWVPLTVPMMLSKRFWRWKTRSTRICEVITPQMFS